MPRTTAVLRSAAAVPTLLGSLKPLPESFGWFAYAPLTPALAGEQVRPWVAPALPVALALLALWAPRLLRPAGLVLVVAALAARLGLPRGPFEDDAVHWASAGALALAALLLLAARGAPPDRQAVLPALAWTGALLILLVRPVAAGTTPLGLQTLLAAEATPLVVVAWLATVAAPRKEDGGVPQWSRGRGRP
ncbi:hypothetical protein [Nonomuraea sp. NPDC023979]|uniref:hypothetical protein n=1 Tax=Nonomuraea sp. NPDC023979 TaxID=3154796 RepID=UPI0033F047CC